MTERKWTPGPWYIDGYNETRDGGYVEVKSEKFHWVCSVTDYSDGTANPNAHLISAAPGLYDALETLVELCNNTSPFGGELQEDRIERTFVAATAALSKARGEA